MTDTNLKTAIADGVAMLTLSRPDKLNAFNSALHAELRQALTSAATDEAVKVVAITGEGRAFSSGQDLTVDLPRGDDGQLDLGVALDRDYNPLIKMLASYPKVTIAALNGPAVGASANIALACDIVVAARSATIHEAFARIALVPDAGGTYVLPRLVGPKRALAMMLMADPVPAEQALAWGLVSQVFDDDVFQGEVMTLARRLASGPSQTYRFIKEAVAASLGNDLGAQLELEKELQRRCGRSYDFEEGVTAFREKRKPAFKGR